MSVEADTRVWDKTARSYAKSKISDQQGYQRTLDRTRSLLKPTDRALELGCGTGSTALLLAGHVQSYLATDISPEMIKICEEKKQDGNAAGSHALSFRAASAESLAAENPSFNVILGFNYLHLVRDLPTTLQSVYSMLEDGGLFVTKTACVGDMNVLLPWVVLPVMQMVGKAPYVNVFRAGDFVNQICSAGFEVLCMEMHASPGKEYENRWYMVARKPASSR